MVRRRLKSLAFHLERLPCPRVGDSATALATDRGKVAPSPLVSEGREEADEDQRQPPKRAHRRVDPAFDRAADTTITRIADGPCQEAGYTNKIAEQVQFNRSETAKQQDTNTDRPSSSRTTASGAEDGKMGFGFVYADHQRDNQS